MGYAWGNVRRRERLAQVTAAVTRSIVKRLWYEYLYIEMLGKECSYYSSYSTEKRQLWHFLQGGRKKDPFAF